MTDPIAGGLSPELPQVAGSISDPVARRTSSPGSLERSREILETEIEAEHKRQLAESPGENPRSPRRILLSLLRNPASLLGIVLLAGFIIIATLAPRLAPCPPEPRYQNVCGLDPYHVPRYGYGTEPKAPSSVERYRWGTTATQYDIYYGVIWGTRTAFKVGVIITIISLIIGLSVGSVAAYYGGWVDEVVMRIVEVFQAFPYFLAAITLATVLQQVQLKDFVPKAIFDLGFLPSQITGVVPAMIALIAFGWTGYARLIRSDILSIKQRDYVWAARSLGASDRRIILSHILPNAIFPVLVVASLEIGSIVLSFAALSFFGLGVPDGYADWGQMISSARDRVPSLVKDWYIVIYPGMAIMLFSLSWNLVGDAFRDILDPRLAKG